jgi:protocatechuate 3,4-dioxygenase beta subunit
LDDSRFKLRLKTAIRFDQTVGTYASRRNFFRRLGLLDTRGDPIRGATVELWEAESMGVYLADQPNRTKFDAHFQGFGRFLTGSTGEYYHQAGCLHRSPSAAHPFQDQNEGAGAIHDPDLR